MQVLTSKQSECKPQPRLNTPNHSGICYADNSGYPTLGFPIMAFSFPKCNTLFIMHTKLVIPRDQTHGKNTNPATLAYFLMVRLQYFNFWSKVRQIHKSSSLLLVRFSQPVLTGANKQRWLFANMLWHPCTRYLLFISY